MEILVKRLLSPFLAVFLILLSPVQHLAAQGKDYLLIADLNVQIDATEALNNMYNFKFRQAARQFNWLRLEYPRHPLPYFLLGLNEWWQIMPDLDNESHDARFIAYMDTSLTLAKVLYDVDSSKVEGAFFIAAANAFQARLYSERRQWWKAAVTTSRSLNYLDECRNKEELSPELMFGDGLYNYFSNWIPDNYPQLKPFLIMFDRGDKQMGLEQLREVAHNAFYTRTEAQYWLMRILFTEENDAQRALHEAEYLHTTYPDNAYFHRYYARMLYSNGQLVKAKIVSEDLLAKIDSGYVGYEATGGRYACFFLGQIWESNMENTKAINFYKRSVEFSEKTNAVESGYCLYSLMGIARIYSKTGNEKEAMEYLKKVRKNSKRKHPANQAARDAMKSLHEEDDN